MWTKRVYTSIGGATIQLSDARRANNAGENIRSSSSSSYSSSWYQCIVSYHIQNSVRHKSIFEKPRSGLSLSLSANQKQKVNVWKRWAMTKSKLSISLVNSLIGANRSIPYIFLFLYVFCTAVTLSLLPMKDSIFEFYVNFFSVFISLFLLWLVRSTSVRLLTE